MEKKQYKAPSVKVVELKTERGFGASFVKQNDAFEMAFDTDGARNEQYSFTDESTFWN